MTSYTQYMIDNCVSSDTCSEIHTPHMPVPTRYTSQHMEQQDVPSLTKLHGLRRGADWNEGKRTLGGVLRR